MADRYWVNGTGTWDRSDTTHWSASSGGVGGETVPVPTDDVYFDENSFSDDDSVVTLSEYPASYISCQNLDFSGITHTISFVSSGTVELFVNDSIYCSPLAVFINDYPTNYVGIHFTSPLTLPYAGAGSVHYIQSNGMEFGCFISIQGNGANYDVQEDGTKPQLILLDDLVMTPPWSLTIASDAVFDANGFDVTTSFLHMFSNYHSVSNVHMGGGTWTITPGIDYSGGYTSTGMVYDQGGLFGPVTSTMYPENSTLVIDNVRAPAPPQTFTCFDMWPARWDGKLQNLIIDGREIGANNNLFALGYGPTASDPTLNIDIGTFSIINSPVTVTFAGSPHYCYCDNFEANGSDGKLITLRSNSNFIYYIDADASSISFVRVSGSTAQGTIPFDDTDGGIDSGGNTNWAFPIPQASIF